MNTAKYSPTSLFHPFTLLRSYLRERRHLACGVFFPYHMATFNARTLHTVPFSYNPQRRY